jgi:uncharacterized protein involved in exopolysaccharide biosynthesis
MADVFAKVRDVVRRRYKVLGSHHRVGHAGRRRHHDDAQTLLSGQSVSRSTEAKPFDNQGEAQAQLATEAIETEVSVISSLEMAQGCFADEPDQRSEFGKGAAKPGLTPEQKLDAVAGALASATNVSREKLTYILAIKVASLDPEKAALLANEFAAAYMDTKVGTNIGTASKQADFFEAQLDRMGNEARRRRKGGPVCRSGRDCAAMPRTAKP